MMEGYGIVEEKQKFVYITPKMLTKLKCNNITTQEGGDLNENKEVQ